VEVYGGVTIMTALTCMCCVLLCRRCRLGLLPFKVLTYLLVSEVQRRKFRTQQRP